MSDDSPLGALLSLLVDSIEATACEIFERPPDGAALVRRAAIGWPEGNGPAPILGANDEFAATSRLPEPVIFSDASTEARFAIPERLARYGVRLALRASLGDDEGPLGVLGVYRTRPRPFTRPELASIRQAARIATRALREDDLHQRVDLVERLERIALVSLDDQGNVSSWSRSAELLSGYGADRMRGSPLSVLWRREEANEPDLEEILDTVRKGGAIRDEVWCRRGDGSSYCAEITLIPAPSAIGRSRGFLSMLHDVTERRRTEESLRAGDEQFRFLYENFPDGIFTARPDGGFLDLNPAGLRMLGYGSIEELGSIDPAQGLYANPDDPSRIRDRLEGRGVVEDLRVDMRKRTGQKLPVRMTAAAVRDDAGRLIASRGTLHNLTGEQRLEEQLRHAQKMEAMGRLAGGVAHDFNNLLTVIQTAGFFARRELPENHPVQGSLRDIDEASRRAADLTRQLLSFSSRPVTQSKRVDLNHQIASLEKMLGRILPENVELVTLLAPGLGGVQMDPGELEQLVVNLVVNACDAMPEGGRLFLETANVRLEDETLPPGAPLERGDYVMLVVCDTGCGMSEPVLAQIFEPFFTTKEIGKGTGLGLATCYGIATQRGGWIQVESEVDLGTTFRVYLPRASGPSEERAKSETGPSRAPGHEHLLLVDDDEAVRRLVAASLRDRGYTVIEAASGEEALRFAEKGDRIDILVSDVVMPRINGYELAERLREEHPELPVLLVSGYAKPLIEGERRHSPQTPLLSKPFDPDVLATKIREILETRPPSTGAPGY